MSNVIFKRNDEAIATDGGDFKGLNNSGIYDCTIVRASMNGNPDDQRKSVVLSVKTSEGEETTIYNGLQFIQKDGSEHYQAKTLNALLSILDIDELSVEKETHTFGTKSVELDVIQELTDTEVKIKIVKGWYRKKDGSLGSSMEVKRFYSIKDGATASEITNQVAELKQLKMDMEYASQDSYGKGISKSDVEAPQSGNAPAAPVAKPNIFNKAQ